MRVVSGQLNADEQIGVPIAIEETAKRLRERKRSGRLGDSLEHTSDFGTMGFRLRRARCVIPKGVKLRRKHRSRQARERKLAVAELSL